jgi:hypothetical protein
MRYIRINLKSVKADIVASRHDKSIYFLDTDDLIAMQEGRDVLPEAFAPKET